MTYMKHSILNIVNDIKPFDALEKKHKDDVIAWVESDEPLFRISKPDNPPKHLVSYFVLFDERTNEIMLIDHRKAEAWLPTGGHVDIDEDPRTTVLREAYEELQITGKFDTVFGKDAIFITVNKTKGEGSHTDVSLWYVISGSSQVKLVYDTREMNSYKWLSLEEVLAMDITELDPNMHRFIHKMQTLQ